MAILKTHLTLCKQMLNIKSDCYNILILLTLNRYIYQHLLKIAQIIILPAFCTAIQFNWDKSGTSVKTNGIYFLTCHFCFILLNQPKMQIMLILDF